MHIETITNSWIGCGTPSTPDGMTSCAPSPPNIATSSALSQRAQEAYNPAKPASWTHQGPWARINVSSLINDLEIPTIGVLNGPGFHTEICLMCDLTICSEEAILYGLHYDILGNAPLEVGEFGTRRWYSQLLPGVAGSQASRLRVADGPGDRRQDGVGIWDGQRSCTTGKLLERAWHLADHIMTQPRTTRRLTTQIVRRPWGPYQIKSRVRSEGQEEQLRLACPFIEMGRREAVSPPIVANSGPEGGKRWSKRSGRHSARVEL